MQYRFVICDVFTKERFGGNQLAVLPAARGLGARQMQRIAREFNFSESAFVLPSDNVYARKVRIFTPTMEVPFAGHPTIGTAFVLANEGELGEVGQGVTVTFDEEAGPVVVTARRNDDGLIWCELAAPQSFSLGEAVDAETMAAVLSLDPVDIRTTTHSPQIAGVGLPFLIVELESQDALRRARVDIAGLERLGKAGIVTDLHLYVRSGDEFDIRARMFAPLAGLPEDPATGSANCALAGLLEWSGTGNSSGSSWRIAQGIEMGRPSVMEARACRENDEIKVWIGGNSVLVAAGFLQLD